MRTLHTIFICVCSLFCIELQTQDYFRLRNNPNIEVLLEGGPVSTDSKAVHERLGILAQTSREGFGSSVQEWKDSKGTIGNIATAELELVFEDGDRELVPVKTKTGKDCHTTITLPGIATYEPRDLSESFGTIFDGVIFKKANSFYPDTEVQLADALLLTPEYLEILSKSCLKKKGVSLKLVVLHVHTELDPCPKCRLLWSTISELMNKSGSEWLYNHLCSKLANVDRFKASLDSEEKKLETLRQQSADTKKLQEQSKKIIVNLKTQLKQETQVIRPRWTELRERMKQLRSMVKMIPRFIVEMSSARPYGDARTLCLDEFSVPEAQEIHSIIDLRTTPAVLLGLSRLAIIPGAYCIFTHFLDPYQPRSLKARYEVVPGMTLAQLMLEQAKSLGS